jgi:mono/diheme cytochrome c family protein
MPRTVGNRRPWAATGIATGIAFVIAAGLGAASLGLWAIWPAAAQESAPVAGGYHLPFASSQRGRELFVNKGCVVCHSVNGVGGHVGPALDVDPMHPELDVFEFAARMWRGARTMIMLQEMEAGFQIDLSGEELANIAHFLHDYEAQRSFSEAEIPPLVRQLMKEETYKELEL